MNETLQRNHYREVIDCCSTCLYGTYGDMVPVEGAVHDGHGVIEEVPEMWCERIGATDDSDMIKPHGWCEEWKKKEN